MVASSIALFRIESGKDKVMLVKDRKFQNLEFFISLPSQGTRVKTQSLALDVQTREIIFFPRVIKAVCLPLSGFLLLDFSTFFAIVNTGTC